MAETGTYTINEFHGVRDGSVKHAESLNFSVASDTYVTIFDMDVRAFKGRIGLAVSNEGANGVDVQVEYSYNWDEVGVDTVADQRFIEIDPTTTPSGTVGTGAKTTFDMNPLRRPANVRVQVKRTVAAASTTANLFIYAEEF